MAYPINDNKTNLNSEFHWWPFENSLQDKVKEIAAVIFEKIYEFFTFIADCYTELEAFLFSKDGKVVLQNPDSQKVEDQEKQNAEKKRLEQEKLNNEKLLNEKAEKNRIEQEKINNEKLQNKKAVQDRLEQEKINNEKLLNEKAEQDRIEQEKINNEKIENERIEKDRIEQERVKKEKIENERIEKEGTNKLTITLQKSIRAYNAIHNLEKLKTSEVERIRIEELDRKENEEINAAVNYVKECIKERFPECNDDYIDKIENELKGSSTTKSSKHKNILNFVDKEWDSIESDKALSSQEALERFKKLERHLGKYKSEYIFENKWFEVPIDCKTKYPFYLLLALAKQSQDFREYIKYNKNKFDNNQKIILDDVYSENFNILINQICPNYNDSIEPLVIDSMDFKAVKSLLLCSISTGFLEIAKKCANRLNELVETTNPNKTTSEAMLSMLVNKVNPSFIIQKTILGFFRSFNCDRTIVYVDLKYTNNNQVYDTDLEYLADKAPGIQHLRINGKNGRITNEGIECIRKFKKLESLEISNIDQEIRGNIKVKWPLVNLRSILTDLSLKNLSILNCCSSNSLDLDDRLKNLNSLSILNATVADINFGEIPNLNSLTLGDAISLKLFVSSIIRDFDINSISKNASITVLNLSGCESLTKECFKSLLNMPSLEIVTFPRTLDTHEFKIQYKKKYSQSDIKVY